MLEPRSALASVLPAAGRDGADGRRQLKLGEAVVTSAAFAKACPKGLRSLGPHALAGIAAPQEVFALSDRL